MKCGAGGNRGFAGWCECLPESGCGLQWKLHAAHHLSSGRPAGRAGRGPPGSGPGGGPKYPNLVAARRGGKGTRPARSASGVDGIGLGSRLPRLSARCPGAPRALRGHTQTGGAPRPAGWPSAGRAGPRRGGPGRRALAAARGGPLGRSPRRPAGPTAGGSLPRVGGRRAESPPGRADILGEPEGRTLSPGSSPAIRSPGGGQGGGTPPSG